MGTTAEKARENKDLACDAALSSAGMILDAKTDFNRAVGHLLWVRQPISDGLIRTYLDQAAAAMDLGLNLCLMAREQLQAARRAGM